MGPKGAPRHGLYGIPVSPIASRGILVLLFEPEFKTQILAAAAADFINLNFASGKYLLNTKMKNRVFNLIVFFDLPNLLIGDGSSQFLI